MKDKLIVVAGGGGFIGGHLVARLREMGFEQIRSVDVKPLDEWYQVFDDVENIEADLKLRDECQDACRGASEVYNLAADMGGMGFIENNKALCMLSVLINTHLLQAALDAKVDRFFYAVERLRLQRRQAEERRRRAAQGRRRLPGHAGRRLRLGEAVFASGCAGTSARTSVSSPAWPASTTCTARTAPGTAAARRRRPRSAAR